MHELAFIFNSKSTGSRFAVSGIAFGGELQRDRRRI